MIVTATDYLSRATEFFGFQYEFAVNALLASIVVGVVCGVVGTFLVLEGMSLLGDAAGHATLPGVCVGFLLVGSKAVLPLLLGALVSGFLASLLVGVLSRGPRSRPDASIGVVLSVFFGIGIVLLSYVQNSPTAAQSGLQSYLFGNAAAVSREQLRVLAGVGVVLLGATIVFYRPLMTTLFDKDFARSLGIRTNLVEYALLGALSLAVVISIQSVGVVLVSAMLIIPGSAAMFLSQKLPRVLVFAGLIGATSGALGAFISYVQEGVATGPAMVLVASALFILAAAFGPRGLVARKLRKSASSASSSPHATSAGPATE